MRLAIGVALVLWCPAVGSGQTGTVRTVVSDSTGRGLAGASVTLASRPPQLTDRSGIAEFQDLAPGRYLIEVRAVGHLAASSRVTLLPTETRLEIRIIVQRAPKQLDSLVVEADPIAGASARLKAFEYRRQTGLGRYLTRPDIERLHANSVGQLLRMIPSGVTVRDSLGIPQAISERGKKLVWDAEQGGYRVVSCVLRLMIDDQLMPWGTSIEMLDPTQIAGIEIYLGASEIPAQLASSGRDQFCGLLVLWSR